MFAILLLREFLENFRNSYIDNVDRDRLELLKKFMRIASRQGYEASPVQLEKPYNVNQFAVLKEHFEGFAQLYEALGDEPSRELLLKVIALRILGNVRVRLPLNTEEYWKERARIKSLAGDAPVEQIESLRHALPLFKLHEAGWPIELFGLAANIHTLFLTRQYEYNLITPPVKVKSGDVVFDCGGGWGETALYFASLAGESGRVFTFEFGIENLRITGKNMSRNPALKDRVQLIEMALWDESDMTLPCVEGGFGSRVCEVPEGGKNKSVRTISIDDAIERYEISRVDFIKMDIEGAELKALYGAGETLRRFRPDCAISLYHNFTDFVEIPRYLRSINPGYALYFGHSTIHPEESVLFATDRSAP